MAHNLATINGRTAMAYQGATPWHGLGTRLHAMTSVQQALEAGNLNWEVELRDLYFRGANGTAEDQLVQSSTRRAVVRTVDGAELGTVGPSYHVVQNSAAFEVLQPACERFGVTIESAGALGNGARVWMLARMPETVEVGPGDTINGYFLAVTSHDGSMGLRAKATPVRVVCQNTLNAAGVDRDTIVSIRHTASAADRLREAERTVTQLVGALKASGETFRKLYQTRMSATDVAKYVEAVFPAPADKPTPDVLVRRRHTVSKLVWEGRGAQLAGADAGGATAWAAYNAVTEYFDHVRPAEAQSASARRAANESAVFGASDLIKQLALRKARELVTV